VNPAVRCTRLAAVGVAFVVALGGCESGDKGKGASQVVASVNGEDITLQQVNQTLARAGNIPEGQQKQAQQQVLERLIDQQLLVQQALEKKLDRDPRVVAAIDAAKRQILAQMRLEQVMQEAPKSTPEEVKAFYSEHPELFHDRRFYRFKQLIIAAPETMQAALQTELVRLEKQPNKNETLTNLAKWLQARDVKFQANITTQSAEQLPMEVLAKVHRMKDGDLLVMPRGNTIDVSQLDRSQAAPLTEEQSGPYIEQFLQNRKRMDLSTAEVKRLRAAAKIQYRGELASSAAQTAQKPTAVGAEAAPGTSTPATAPPGAK